jgi:hypothetical protein
VRSSFSDTAPDNTVLGVTERRRMCSPCLPDWLRTAAGAAWEPLIISARGSAEPRLVDVVNRLRYSSVGEDLSARMLTLVSEPTELPAEELQAALVAHSWFLDRAKGGGIELTSAGYLKPADVEEASAVVPFRDVSVIGPAFMVNAVAGVVIAVLLVSWRSWVPGFLAAGFGVCTLGAFVVASTVGLFGVHEHWVGWSVWTAAVAEVVAIVAGGLVLVRGLPAMSTGHVQHRPSVPGAHGA